MRNQNFYSSIPPEKEIFIINGFQHYYLDNHSTGYVDEKHNGTIKQFLANVQRLRKYATNRGSLVLFTSDKVDGNRQLIDRDIDPIKANATEEDILNEITQGENFEYYIDIEKGNIFSNSTIDTIFKAIKPLQVFTGGIPFSSTVFNTANGVRLRGIPSYCITDLVVDYKDKKEKPTIELFLNSRISFTKMGNILEGK